MPSTGCLWPRSSAARTCVVRCLGVVRIMGWPAAPCGWSVHIHIQTHADHMQMRAGDPQAAVEQDGEAPHTPPMGIPFDAWFMFLCVAGARFLAVHGGIGRLETLEQIRDARRPITEGSSTPESERVLCECVWSDPAKSDSDLGFLQSGRDSAGTGRIILFGADVAERFCKVSMGGAGHGRRLWGWGVAGRGTCTAACSMNNSPRAAAPALTQMAIPCRHHPCIPAPLLPQRNNITAILRGHECIKEVRCLPACPTSRTNCDPTLDAALFLPCACVWLAGAGQATTVKMQAASIPYVPQTQGNSKRSPCTPYSTAYVAAGPGGRIWRAGDHLLFGCQLHRPPQQRGLRAAAGSRHVCRCVHHSLRLRSCHRRACAASFLPPGCDALLSHAPPFATTSPTHPSTHPLRPLTLPRTSPDHPPGRPPPSLPRTPHPPPRPPYLHADGCRDIEIQPMRLEARQVPASYLLDALDPQQASAGSPLAAGAEADGMEQVPGELGQGGAEAAEGGVGRLLVEVAVFDDGGSFEIEVPAFSAEDDEMHDVHLGPPPEAVAEAGGDDRGPRVDQRWPAGPGAQQQLGSPAVVGALAAAHEKLLAATPPRRSRDVGVMGGCGSSAT